MLENASWVSWLIKLPVVSYRQCLPILPHLLFSTPMLCSHSILVGGTERQNRWANNKNLVKETTESVEVEFLLSVQERPAGWCILVNQPHNDSVNSLRSSHSKCCKCCNPQFENYITSLHF